MKTGISSLSGWIVLLAVTLSCGVALYIRVYLPQDQVFTGEWIKFTSVDAYYFMRWVDNLAHNFPHVIGFDPFFVFPEGTAIAEVHFFQQMLAGLAWIIGLGSPTQHTIDMVGVYLPPILAALGVIPVYFIGRVLFGRWAGVIAATVIAILPGEYLGRSVLGFTDYHVLEAVLTTTTMLFLILAIKVARQRQLAFRHVYQRNCTVILRPAIFGLLAGIFLAVYMLTWPGALLFVLLLFVYSVIQSIIDHLQGKSLDYLCLVVSIPLLFAGLVVYATIQPGIDYGLSIVVALLAPLALNCLSRLLRSKAAKPGYYPLVVAGTGVAGFVVLFALEPDLVRKLLGYFLIFAPAGHSRTIIEMEPLLFPGGKFSFGVMWVNYTTTFFLSVFSLGVLAYLAIKHHNAAKSLLVVWSLLTLALNLGQRRFGYYYSVNVALLTGCLSWWVLRYVGFSDQAATPEAPAQAERGRAKLKGRRRRKASFKSKSDPMVMCLAVIIIFFAVFFPNINLVIANAKSPHFAPSDAWYETLTWMRQSTPEPFGNPDYYYELYQISPSGANYVCPASAYGVMSWWDYGYWITRLAHRVPVVNPGYNYERPDVARFFTTDNETLGKDLVNEMGVKYIVIDYATVGSKFWALAKWMDRREDEFYDVYYYREDNKLTPACLYYPEYYRTLSVRLYNFDGKAVAAPKPIVISYEERTSNEGGRYKELISARDFSDYQDALNYVASQKSGNYKIVSGNPFISPIPLEELKEYRVVYRSSTGLQIPEVGQVSEVKVFEYSSGT